MRLIHFLFPPEKREAPVQTPEMKRLTHEEYLRELENDPYFEEISGEELWALIVGAAHPSKSEQPPESPESSAGDDDGELPNQCVCIAVNPRH